MKWHSCLGAVILSVGWGVPGFGLELFGYTFETRRSEYLMPGLRKLSCHLVRHYRAKSCEVLNVSANEVECHFTHHVIYGSYKTLVEKFDTL